MALFIIVVVLFLLSLLILFRAPTKLLWYVAILVTEFCWIFILALLILLICPAGSYQLLKTITGIAALLIYSLPVFQALLMHKKVVKEMALRFSTTTSANSHLPFQPLQMITGIGAKKVAYKTLVYDEDNGLTLHFYPSVIAGQRPCVIVIHGGSWAAGNNLQLPDLNSKLANAGYHVASIHYRLAPNHRYPNQLHDVKMAVNYLAAQSTVLSIHSNAFTLLGRSAGGQIALSAAYTLKDERIKGVIAFYAPADMVWGYQIRCNPLVLDSRKVMEDYLGGTLQQQHQQYSDSSPTVSVNKEAPPTLLFYAEHDPLVHPRHGNRLTKRLEEEGIKHVALYLPWATHGFDYTLNGPAGQVSTWTVLRFLEAVYQP